MKPRKQVPASPADDRGAALLMVLVVVTVIALAGAAMLSFSDTSIRTTVALRDQGAAAYAAEGAAQVAISKLQQASFPNKCATQTGDGLALGDGTSAFYKSAQSSSTALNAYVWCSPDVANGTGGGPTAANASPGNALLTLGTSKIDEDGIWIDARAPVKVRGGVFSNSTIYIKRGGLENTLNNPPSLPYIRARGACTNLTPSSDRKCNYTDVDPLGTDPGTLTPHGASYDSPAAPTANGSISPPTATCGSSRIQTLTPGRYTSAADLNGLTGCNKKLVILDPGTYFFDFQGKGNHTWTVDDTYVVAGTPTPTSLLNNTPTPTQMLTACRTPDDPAATTSSGVRLVFGGDSRLRVKDTANNKSGGQITICASKSANGPPIAISGQKAALPGSFPVAAQNGCITDTSSGCTLIGADLSPHTNLTIQGTMYTPNAWVDLSLTDDMNQVFRWGLIARALSIVANSNANLDLPVVDVPDAAASSTPVPDIMVLSVYVCPGTAPCSKAGALGLTAKVQVGDTAVKVLSWSVKR